MDSVNTSSTSRTSADSPLEPIPSEIWTCIVVRHIALREGRTITSLACVSSLFAQWARPHLKPVALYRELEGAREGTAETALRRAMGTLHELPGVDEAHRLELFLLVSGTLQRHFPGMEMAPHIDTLLGNLQRLPLSDQPAALLHIMTSHSLGPNGPTVPRYLGMASRVGALPPSPEQARLAERLIDDIPADNDQAFAAKAEAFMSMCAQLQPAYRAGTLSALLYRLHRLRYATLHPFFLPADEHGQKLSRKELLVSGVHACLRSMPMHELPEREATLLFGWATILPPLLPDDGEADKMAIDLLGMMRARDDAVYRWHEPDSRKSLHDCVEEMLERIFDRGPRQSVSRFQRLYQAMAHLPPMQQSWWMRAILVRCATQAEAGVTPALIVATAQAALGLAPSFPKFLPDLFALSLNPGPLRRSSSMPPLRPPTIDPSAILDYTNRFDANCGELMRLLREGTPEAAGRLLAAINDAYREKGRTEPILAGSSACRAALYGRFLKHALAFLGSQPPAAAADCLLQWRLPAPDGLDARGADERVISLLAVMKELARDSEAAPVLTLQAALAALMQDAFVGRGHSPAGNRRLLAALSAFPDDVCAGVLNHLLASRYMSPDAFDVLFASIVEAARSLPDAPRCAVLTTATGQLHRFPVHRKMLLTDPDTLLGARQQAFDRQHPGLQASDPELHAYLQPGCVSRMEGLAQLLDAMKTLPAQPQAELLRLLSKRDTFFAFANGRIAIPDQLECSMRLLSGILGLPHEMAAMRTDVYAVWLKHFTWQFQGDIRETAENRLLASLFALPAREGRPLFEAYVDRIGYAPSKAALRQRAHANWGDAN